MFFKQTYFRLPPGGVFRHCALKFAKKSRMKRSSALSTLHNGSFRKPRYFAFFVVVVVVFASILLERINLKLLTTE